MPLVKFTIDHELALPLPAFPVCNVSGKVWPTLITTQQVGIYLKILLDSAAYCMSSLTPSPIYWLISLCVYSPCANILALRMLSVKIVTIYHIYANRNSITGIFTNPI